MALDKYIYKHLKIYGNTIITEETYDRLGERKILKDLKQHGYDCVIRINPVLVHGNKGEFIDRYIIVERRDKNGR